MTDDEQLEVVKHWLKENGAWIAGGIVLALAIIFGMRFYRDHANQEGMAASMLFGAATSALEANDRAKSRTLADAVIKDHSGTPYADQARLLLARLDVDEGKSPNAVAPLTQVMNDSKDSQLRNVARLRLARILIDQGKPDEALKTLADPIPQGFGTPFREVRGDAYAAKKDAGAAVTEYQAALASADPGGIVASVLGLKIQDLGGPKAPATVSTDSKPKAKP
ncbi:MAG TPA: tetratricopeptide repeat protein [Steroidobacteraceae bacterium]|nr:tetratricopeptide repeat protein [Steroidobacteraceae bacterium]